MNTLTIAAAIATRFTGLTATYDGVTESLISDPTALLPNQLSKGPVILVFPPEGELSVNLRRRADTLVFPVRLLRDPLEYPVRSGWLYAWYDAMRDQVGKSMNLGLAYVAWAEPTNVRVEVDGYKYAGVPQDVVELEVAVRLDEVITTLAVT
jgi:hypothetical protein